MEAKKAQKQGKDGNTKEDYPKARRVPCICSTHFDGITKQM